MHVVVDLFLKTVFLFPFLVNHWLYLQQVWHVLPMLMFYEAMTTATCKCFTDR